MVFWLTILWVLSIMVAVFVLPCIFGRLVAMYSHNKIVDKRLDWLEKEVVKIQKSK